MDVNSDDAINGQARPLLSVIVPVFNEAATVAQALTALLEELTPKEIIIVDDGSTDTTAGVVESWESSVPGMAHSAGRIICIRHPVNRGKGSAVRTALEHATGRFVVVQDADLEVQPDCFPKLLKPLCDGTADFVIGYRRNSRKSSAVFHWFGVKLLGIVTRLLYGYRVHDAACCYKVLSLENLRAIQLEADRFEFCPEVLAKVCRMKLRISQVPVDYFPRSIRNGKKLRLLKDGWKAVQTLFRYRLWSPSRDS